MVNLNPKSGFSTSHSFALIKLRFSEVQAMFSDGPRELQDRKSSSRAGLVTFFESRLGARLGRVG